MAYRNRPLAMFLHRFHPTLVQLHRSIIVGLSTIQKGVALSYCCDKKGRVAEVNL